MALDGIVNVNSLFTLALFLGIVNADPSNPSYTLVSKNNGSSSCLAPSFVAEDLIAYHVYSFSSFLFSSLIASALKQAIKTNGGGVGGQATRPTNVMVVHVNSVVLRIGILACACGSVFGCVFLMLGLVNLVQIKLGVLACRDFYTLAACVPLLVLVPLALVLYICIILHASTS
uniref:Maternal effect embryo arrest 60 n=2 Tax=Chenopodium quinoa TaxID=63459 RepID=A0A803LX60_CHEQI